MKIRTAQLKQIIKEEVQRVRETPEEVNIGVSLDAAATKIEKIAAEMYGLVNPDAPPKSPHYQIGDTLAAELEAAVGELNQIHAQLIPGAAGDAMAEADEGGPGVHDIFNLPEPEAVEPSGNPKEDALRQIVADSQAMKVEGTFVDLTTANAIIQMLDALRAKVDKGEMKPEIPEMYLNAPIEMMAKQALGR